VFYAQLIRLLQIANSFDWQVAVEDNDGIFELLEHRWTSLNLHFLSLAWIQNSDNKKSPEHLSTGLQFIRMGEVWQRASGLLYSTVFNNNEDTKRF